MSGLKFKRPKQTNRQPLSISEISQLFAATNTLKETAILHLFYSLGLRKSEAQALNSSDLHFKERLLYVRAGKGAKRRVLPMTEKVAQALEAYYFTERCSSQAKKVKDEAAFMLNRTGQRMQGNSYHALLKVLLTKAGITKDISLHHLRHSIATHLLRSGMPLEKVRDFLGHHYLETTQLYAKVKSDPLKL